MSRKLSLVLAILAAVAALSGPASATVFGLKNCGSGDGISGICSAGFVFGGGSMAPTMLFSYGENAAALNAGQFVVTNGGIGVHVDALAIDGANTLYAYQLTTTVTPADPAPSVAADVTASQLVTLNPATGAVASVIGTALAGRDIRGASFGPLGRLWTIDATSNELLRINPATGAIQSPIGLTLDGNPFDLTTMSDIAFRADGTAILNNLNSYYTVDLATGALSLLFSAAGVGGLGNQYAGLTFSDGAASDLLFAYDVSGFDDLRNFDLGNGNLETQQIANIIPNLGGATFNSGRGDLAAHVTFADATAPEPGALALLGAGLLGFAMTRRRGKSETPR